MLQAPATDMLFWPKSPFIPDLRFLPEYLLRKQCERTKNKEEQGLARQWFLLAGRTDKKALLDPQPAQLHKIIPPNDRIWADPFLWKRGDDFFVFCEEWLYNRRHGHLSVMQLSSDGSSVSTPIPIVEENHHLSYPFVFEYEGELYMMPEAGAAASIDIYRCEEFPHRWRMHTTLMRNIRYADATLKEHEGKWWLFATVKRGLFALSRDLFVFSADSPLTDKWTPHPENPVVRSIYGARPAGPLFALGEKLFRPSQDCMIRYGYGLRINEIQELNGTRYRERLVTEVTPDWEAGIRANHHIDWLDGMMVMDTQRLIRESEAARS